MEAIGVTICVLKVVDSQDSLSLLLKNHCHRVHCDKSPRRLTTLPSCYRLCLTPIKATKA